MKCAIIDMKIIWFFDTSKKETARLTVDKRQLADKLVWAHETFELASMYIGSRRRKKVHKPIQ